MLRPPPASAVSPFGMLFTCGIWSALGGFRTVIRNTLKDMAGEHWIISGHKVVSRGFPRLKANRNKQAYKHTGYLQSMAGFGNVRHEISHIWVALDELEAGIDQNRVRPKVGWGQPDVGRARQIFDRVRSG